MNRITVTYRIAMAAGQDEGNRSMKAAGRTKWNEEDWNASAAMFNRLYSVEDGLAEAAEA